jgi:hypothetical protein
LCLLCQDRVSLLSFRIAKSQKVTQYLWAHWFSMLLCPCVTPISKSFLCYCCNQCCSFLTVFVSCYGSAVICGNSFVGLFAYMQVLSGNIIVYVDVTFVEIVL